MDTKNMHQPCPKEGQRFGQMMEIILLDNILYMCLSLTQEEYKCLPTAVWEINWRDWHPFQESRIPSHNTETGNKYRSYGSQGQRMALPLLTS